jgi:hypothetical protein
VLKFVKRSAGAQRGLNQILQIVQALQAENNALKCELEAFQKYSARERTYDCQRIARAGDARADAGDEDDPELLKVGVVVEGPGQHLLGGDKHAQRLGEVEDGRQELDFHD